MGFKNIFTCCCPAPLFRGGHLFLPYKESALPAIKLYDNVEKYIQPAIYPLMKDEFTKPLIRAHARGVEAKALIDKA